MSIKHAAIQTKLLLITISAVIVVACITALAIVGIELGSYESNLRDRLANDAAILSTHLNAALDFNDAQAAQDTLDSLESREYIERAVVYTKDLAMLAAFDRDHDLANNEFPGAVHYRTPIAFNGETIGFLHLIAIPRMFAQSWPLFLMIFVGVVCALSVAASLLVTGIRRYIVTPLRHLDNAVKLVTESASFSVRVATPEHMDEVGRLSKLFNDMLSMIESRDAAQRRLTSIMDATSDLVAMFSPEGDLLYLNAAGREQLGVGQDTPLSEISSADFYGGEETAHLFNTQKAAAIAEGAVDFEMTLYPKSGRPFEVSCVMVSHRNAENEVTAISSICRNIEDVKEYEAQLLHQAHFDSLTSLPNRALAIDRLEQAVSSASAAARQVAVLFFDLDNFKSINDSLGHYVGDKLLVECAERVREIVKAPQTLARFGGDEFVVILPGIVDASEIDSLIIRLRKAFQIPFTCGDHLLYSTASMGISTYPGDADNADQLLQFADAAMYRAKAQRAGGHCYFTEEISQSIQRRKQIEIQLRDAIANNELYVAYQPQVNIRRGAVTGVEALMRWKNSAFNNITPTEFLPIADECGLIVELGSWILRQACEDIKALHNNGHEIKLSVNVTANQISDKSFLPMLLGVLEDTGFPHEYLEIEVTEETLIVNREEVTEVIQSLRSHGIRMSIDDFGTGYSSMNYLVQYPFDTLKIDRSFVVNVLESRQLATLTATIVGMGHQLGLEIIGEGAESPDHVQFLAQHGCDVIQGFYFSKPIKSDDLAVFLQKKSDEFQVGHLLNQEAD